MLRKGIKLVIGLTMLATIVLLVGCGGSGDNNNGNNTATNPPSTTAPDTTQNNTPDTATATEAPIVPETPVATISGPITVITREEGSGTRGAFVEIADITIDGNDNITMEAVVTPSTSGIIENVASNQQAIGYASAGTVLEDSRVKVLKINDVMPSIETMVSGAYEIQRPFIIGYNTSAGLTPLAEDFIDFIFSEQGQAVVVSRGYAPTVSNPPAYVASNLTGKIDVNGSTSVYSLMEYLSEAYRAINSNVTIDIHGTGTGAGITAAKDNITDIAMASRDIRDSELEFLTAMTIAIDGIAVIVNPNNPFENMTLDEVKNIFAGEVTRWESLR